MPIYVYMEEPEREEENQENGYDSNQRRNYCNRWFRMPKSTKKWHLKKFPLGFNKLECIGNLGKWLFEWSDGNVNEIA